MSAAEAQAEPTMEEILASIRRIISEDDAPPVPAESESAESFSEDVLDLSEPVEAIEPVDDVVSSDFDFDALGADEIEEPAAPEPEPVFESEELIAVDIEPELEAEPEMTDDFLEEFDAPEEIAFEEPAPIIQQAPPPKPEPVYAAPLPISDGPVYTPPPIASTIGLIGEEAASATATAFSKLGSSMPNHFASGISVEEVVAYLLKPMLKEWLDTNLPRIVEERVEAELARIARRGF